VIVLDTNVISELMRSAPHPAVVAWVAAQPRGTLYTTGVNEAELFYGIRAMPEGRRRSGLFAGAEALFAEEFAGRVLPFDGAADCRRPLSPGPASPFAESSSEWDAIRKPHPPVTR
jgi:predicted nucleic acid-binding protein